MIAEEFGDWQDSRRRIDLLAVDRDANLIVIELKRTEDGGHMELQALRYAAMVSTMTFERAGVLYARFLEIEEDDARSRLLEFLGWNDSDGEHFAPDVRIVLVSAEFSQELTTAVLWLNKRDIYIRCVRLRPYRDGSRILLDVAQVIPLPEESTYQVRLREKAVAERSTGREWDRPSFFAELRAAGEDGALAERILDWAERQGLRIHWGRSRRGSFRCVQRSPAHNVNYFVCVVRADGKVVLWIDRLLSRPALRDGNAVAQFRQSVGSIPGVTLMGNAEHRPRFHLSDLAAPRAMEAFESAMDALLGTIRSWHREHEDELEDADLDEDE